MAIMRRISSGVPFALLMLAFVSARAFAAAGEYRGGGKTYALLVGLNYDQDAAMAPYQLKYSQNDVEAVREMLVSFCGVDDADIEVLTDLERPNARAIRRKLGELAARAGEDDRILLFYSGHGVVRQGAWAMVPYNFDRDDIDGTLLWNRDITRILEDSHAGEMIFISDSCYSGSKKSLPASFMVKNPDFGSKFPRFDGTAEFIELELGGGWNFSERRAPGSKGGNVEERLVRLCSSGVGEVSREYPPARLGAFTHALTRSVAEWWRSTDYGALTVGGLYQRIVPIVEDTGRHTPFMSDNGDAVVLAEKSVDEARQLPGGGRVYALLIGLRYRNDGSMAANKRLNYTENDVREVRSALLKYGGCREQDITVLTDADRPDRKKILAEIRKLAGRAGRNDSIIFFFSGHGGKKGSYGNIIPHGYRRWEQGVAYAADIKPILEGSKAATKWMIVDACHSGLKSFGFSGEKGWDDGAAYDELDDIDMFVKEEDEYAEWDGPTEKNVRRVSGLIRFTGAHGGEVTYESGRLNMGYFAHFLAKGLNGEADADLDGLLTGGELAGYVTPQVLKATGNKQRPRLTANGYGVVLAAKTVAAPPAAPVRPTRPSTPQPPASPPASPQPSPPPSPSPASPAVPAPQPAAPTFPAPQPVPQPVPQPTPAAPSPTSGSAGAGASGSGGGNALHAAVLSNDYAHAERLLASGADVNAVDETGWSALHYAARADIARLLIGNGARLDQQSGLGYSPLHVAAMFDRPEVVRELVRQGAAVDVKDKWGKDPLYHALKNRSEAAAKALVAARGR